jgi:hypothetical protein
MDARKTNLVGKGGGLTRRGRRVTPTCTASRTNRIGQNRFNRAWLPPPISVLIRLGIIPKSANPAGYCLVKCPLHKNGEEEHASFAIHQVKGNFRCFACGAQGSDVLALWMQHSRKSFEQSAKELGAWGHGYD